MSTKPEFIFIPGAWHSPSSFSPVTTLLTARGYISHGIALPSVGASPALKSFDLDVEAIRNTVNSVLSSGKDVVLVMHSYGSIPTGEALASYVEQLESGAEAQGKGRVLRLVYVTCFILEEGGSLMARLNYTPLPWLDINGDEVTPLNPQEIFYNDLSAAAAAPWISDLKTHSYPTFSSKVSVMPWKVIPSTYVVCEKDNALPLPVQEDMIAMAKGMAANSFDVIERCEASHSPFLSMPEYLASVLVKAAGGA
jgi:pimeloyl-ACP methyl ester carboxylesterase